MSSIGTSAGLARVYWTAFIGLFFDYYDLYLFIYLEKTLAAFFSLTPVQSSWLQFAGLAGVGVGALVFGYLADRFGRGRMMLTVFGVYAAGVAGLSVAWSPGSLLVFRLLASLALGAEWGISHTYLAERVDGARRYRFAALLQFSILGGLLAALMTRYALPVWGWRGLFAASLVPVAVLSLVRWKALMGQESAGSPVVAGPVTDPAANGQRSRERAAQQQSLLPVIASNLRPFLLCLGLASLTIASGTINVFYARELPQSPVYTVFFWGNIVPGMLAGAWVVNRWGVRRALQIYATALIFLSLGAWLCGSAMALTGSARVGLVFALVLPVLNGIPFGLMGAYFNQVLGGFRTMLSGAAYNLGRIAAGFSPLLITALGLQVDGRYFLFTLGLGAGVLGLAGVIGRPGRLQPH